MDKKFVMGIAAMAALTLVSCSSDDLDSFSDNSSKNEAISFDGYLGRSAVAVNGTRGSVETANTLQTNGFGVFSKYSGTSFPDFDNQKVTYSNKKWTYSPLKFWPTEGQIKFYAYAPYKDGKKLKENSTTFDFTVADNAAGQEDLLWANATGETTANSASAKEKVKIHFYHALSRLGYSVKLSGNYSSNNVTFILKNITLAGSTDGNTPAFYKTGTIDLAKTNKDTDLWSNYTGGKLKFNWYSGEYNIPEPEAGTTEPSPSHPDKDNNGTIEKDKDYLFVIPQNFPEKIDDPNHSGQQIDNPDKLYVIVEYTIDYGGGVKVDNKVYKRLTQEFKQGKAYMLNLTIGRPIEFDVDLTEGVGVEGWGTDEGINIGSGSNDNLWDGIE